MPHPKFTITFHADTPEELTRALANMAFAMSGESTIDAPTMPTLTGAPLAPPTADAGDDDDGEPAAGPAPDRDKHGIPWDERIHASTKGLNKDGTWRYRRGVDESTIKAVEQELLMTPPAHMVRPAETAPGVTDAPATTAAPPVTIQPPTGAPAPEPAPAAAMAAPAVTYESVVDLMTKALHAGTITPAGMPQFFTECGVNAIHELRDNPAALFTAYTKLA